MNIRRSFQCMVAVTEQFGIGKNGVLPFHLPGDHQYLLQLTGKTRHPSLRNAVIIGRIGFLQILRGLPVHLQPLPGRLTIVLTSSPPSAKCATAPDHSNSITAAAKRSSASSTESELQQQQLPPSTDELLYADSLEGAMQLVEDGSRCANIDTVFILGGQAIYREAVASERCSALHITHVDANPECDRFFPDIRVAGSPWRLWSSSPPQLDHGVRYQFACYTREPAQGSQLLSLDSQGPGPIDRVGGMPVLPAGMNNAHAELQLLDLVRSLTQRFDPQGSVSGCASNCGVQHRYDLRHNFPLMTCMRDDWQGMIAEVSGFMQGSADVQTAVIESGPDMQMCADSNGIECSGSMMSSSNRSSSNRSSISNRSSSCSSASTTDDIYPDSRLATPPVGGQLVVIAPDMSQPIRTLLRGIVALADGSILDSASPALIHWDPAASRRDDPISAKPPLHEQAPSLIQGQFKVAGGELSCHVYQACGNALHAPFTTGCYALLTYMLAKAAMMRPGDLCYTMGQAYLDPRDLDAAKSLLQTVPTHFPALSIDTGSEAA